MKILSGQWHDREHEKGSVYIADENGKKYHYNFSLDDKAPLNAEIIRRILDGEAEISENQYYRLIDGKEPLPHWAVLVDGNLVDEERAACIFRDKADQRLDELYKGRILAEADNDETYLRNWKRRVRNLVKARRMNTHDCCRLKI